METEVWLFGPLTNNERVQETWDLTGHILQLGFWECYDGLEEIRIVAATPPSQALALAFFANVGFVARDAPTDKQKLYQHGDRCFVGPWRENRITCYLPPSAEPGRQGQEPEPLPPGSEFDAAHRRPPSTDPHHTLQQSITNDVPEDLRHQFATSFQEIEDDKQSSNDLIAQQWRAILSWIKARGFHQQFRFGSSMFRVIISRSRRHDQQADQNSLSIHIHRDGAVDLFYTGSMNKKVYTEPENLFANLEELLTTLAQQPLD